MLELLGEGGMGEVYRAYDRELDELVALKLIRASFAGQPRVLERFRNEVKLAPSMSPTRSRSSTRPGFAERPAR